MVSHMEAQGRPRRVPDADMGSQRAQMEGQGNQKGSKGSPKRATGGVKWSPRGSWKDAVYVPKNNGKHNGKQGFCEVRAASSVPKGVAKRPSDRPSGQERAQGSQGSSPGPNLDAIETPGVPKRILKSYGTLAASTGPSQEDSTKGSPPPK